MKIDRLDYWQGSSETALATSLHLPGNWNIRGTGVLVCSPIGHEYVHTFRSFRFLADKLAERGFAVLRFDYRDTGNSFESGTDGFRIANSVADVTSQMTAMRKYLRVEHICLIGFRIAALIAAAAIDHPESTSLVSWAAPRSGKSYVKELNALAAVSGYSRVESTHIESGGFRYSENLLQDLSEIESKIVDRDSLANRLDIVADGKQVLDSEQTQTTIAPKSEIEGMLLEPHLSEIPADRIDAIADWIDSIDSEPRSTLTETQIQKLSASSTANVGVVSETLVQESQLGLAGVFCRNSDESKCSSQLRVILPNAGSVHSIGPNRIYTEIARFLASYHIESFRFDLPNLGASVIGSPLHENEPYPECAADAMRTAAEYCEKTWGVQPEAYAGLCSGSYTAFLATKQDEAKSPNMLVMINPLTFHWEPGMPLRLGSGQGNAATEANYYARAARTGSSWRRFLTGGVQYGSIAKFSFRHAITSAQQLILGILDRLGITRPTSLTRNLYEIADRGVDISFIFSSRDPGAELLRSETRSASRRMLRSGKISIDTIDGADHTFSQQLHRDDLKNSLLGIFRRRD